MKPDTVVPQPEQHISYKQLALLSRKERALLHITHLIFAVWGTVVRVLHVHASIQTPLVECDPKVLPMAGALPSCFVMNFNCSSLGISAKYEAVQTVWKRFDRSTVIKAQFLHCSALEIPESLRAFNRLREIAVYNSTIVDWRASAAVTNVHHPQLNKISIVRSNLSDGILLSVSRRVTSPKVLWRLISVKPICNTCRMTAPPVLMRLQPYYLVLGGNPITVIPPELFEIEGVIMLTLGRTKVRKLPYNVTQLSSSLQFVDIVDTDISIFPPWIDPLVDRTMELSTSILAGGTVYCSDLEKILSGASTSFSVPIQSEQSLLLMNASAENLDMLQQAVDCSPATEMTQFPLNLWDES